MKPKIAQITRDIVHEAEALDQAIFTAVARTKAPVLDSCMPVLTGAADHSKLWLALATLLGATGSSRARRAALRGVVTLGATSLITNQIAKRLRDRERPLIDQVPLLRRARSLPTSSSLPSGHAASAVAFASAVADELPGIGVPLKTLAGLVGFSRIATGAHYPSDVALGALLGATVAAIGRRLVPPVPLPKVQQPPALELTARPTGRGVVLVVNPSSHSGQGEKVLGKVQRELPDGDVVKLDAKSDISEVMATAAARAEVLAVAGGDGTVGAAAQAAIDAGIPLAVFAAGTFNHFAKAIGAFPIRHSIRAVKRGQGAKVDVGYLNDKIFLNTASLGAYTDFVRIRESLEKRIGKPAAALVAGFRTLSESKSVRIRVDDRTSESSLFFIGNSQYEPRGFAPSVRETLDDGLLDLRILDVSNRLSRIRVLAGLLTGQLNRVPNYHEISSPEVTIELLDGSSQLARDGEIGESARTVHAKVARRALTVCQSSRHKG